MPFKRLEKGAAPTFLSAQFANQVVALLNALIKAEVQPAGSGQVLVTPDRIVIDLSPLGAAQQATQIDLLAKAVAAQQGQLDAIIKSLKGATITAACDPDTSAITVTLNLTKLP